MCPLPSTLSFSTQLFLPPEDTLVSLQLLKNKKYQVHVHLGGLSLVVPCIYSALPHISALLIASSLGTDLPFSVMPTILILQLIYPFHEACLIPLAALGFLFSPHKNHHLLSFA